jgi:hypothetical protein
VRTNCADRLREEEFNDWYSNIHIPDLLAVPGFVRAARYVNPDPSSWETGKYLAIYEIETDNIQDVVDGMATSFPKWNEQGRLKSDLLILVSMTFYQQMNVLTK